MTALVRSAVTSAGVPSHNQENLTAEPRRPQRRKGENGSLCELRVSAVKKKVEENPCRLAYGFRVNADLCSSVFIRGFMLRSLLLTSDGPPGSLLLSAHSAGLPSRCRNSAFSHWAIGRSPISQDG